MTDQGSPLAAAADAALRLAAAQPWDQIALRDIAAAAGLSMSALYGLVQSKDDILDAIAARLDRAAAADFEIDRAAPERERLFDAAMARFDAMEAQRAAIVSILEAEGSRPVAAARLWPRGARTARWLMELAGVDTAGPLGLAKAQGFALILARATRAWLGDDAGDLSRTMATLDRALRDVESWKERVAGGLRRARPRKAAEAGRSESGRSEPGPSAADEG